jgi:EAL domain-containing protein (putative c-di-GMP-specific phosphodiesterase class I)/GGDEF domain-containing protein
MKPMDAPLTDPEPPPTLPPESTERPAATGVASTSSETLAELIAARTLRAVFQPIFDFRTHRYHGYEGLIRGPAGSPWESPAALFSLATTPALLRALDVACIDAIFSAFAALRLPGTLFVNVSPNTLLDPQILELDLPTQLRRMRLDPSRVVIELVENEKIRDFDALREAIAGYRRNGLRVAIDDLGEGFSNLRLWSEVRPDYVKIDRHFVDGIGDDPLKFHLVNAIHELAEQSGASIVAEGIENERDFLTIRDLRVHCAQGFFVARPAARPGHEPGAGIAGALKKRQLFTPRGQPVGLRRTIESLSQPLCPLSPTASNAAAFAAFEDNPELRAIPIVDEQGTPLGLLGRHEVISQFARPYRRELFERRPCTMFMDTGSVIVDRSLTVQEVGRMMSRSGARNMADGFIVTIDGRYAGVGSTQDLMATITEMQLAAARYANPLTHLPGSVPINEHIDRLLEQAHDFTVCYCDIDRFKPFNDQFGYQRGDEVIEMLAASLGEVTDSRFDFVGHIGGDDFIAVFQSEDWEARCRRLLTLFDERIVAFVDPEVAGAGSYEAINRIGTVCAIPIPSLSIGALPVCPGRFESHAEIAAAVAQVKRLAKAQPGSSLFVERRNVQPERRSPD